MRGPDNYVFTSDDVAGAGDGGSSMMRPNSMFLGFFLGGDAAASDGGTVDWAGEISDTLATRRSLREVFCSASEHQCSLKLGSSMVAS